MTTPNHRLTRIGVFYDGNFFLHVSNYYHYVHRRRARISISGLHNFIRQKVAMEEGADAKYCQIVDAHYFRGRVRAQDAERRDLLLKERIFDDILMRQGVTTHYLPLGPEGGEKGIDVWLALEAYELAMYKRFDVSVLVASDGDFVPLLRKLNTLGTRVMVLSWDFQYTDQNGQVKETRTAQSLLDEATYPVLMHQIIDDRSLRNDPLVNGLFVSSKETQVKAVFHEEYPGNAPSMVERGRIQKLKEGFGFIVPEQGGSNIFFYHGEVLNADFTELRINDLVEYRMGRNDHGPCAIGVRVLS